MLIIERHGVGHLQLPPCYCVLPVSTTKEYCYIVRDTYARLCTCVSKLSYISRTSGGFDGASITAAAVVPVMCYEPFSFRNRFTLRTVRARNVLRSSGERPGTFLIR